MTAKIVSLCDAVVQQLGGHTFSQPFVAERYYQPDFKLSEMDSLRVSVVPRSIVMRPLDRLRQTHEYEIDVAVQQKLDSEIDKIDELLELVEEIAEYFRLNPVPPNTGARCVEVRNAPIYASEHLQELRQFTSILTLVYRVWS
jgi:hypothetical protein